MCGAGRMTFCKLMALVLSVVCMITHRRLGMCAHKLKQRSMYMMALQTFLQNLYFNYPVNWLLLLLLLLLLWMLFCMFLLLLAVFFLLLFLLLLFVVVVVKLTFLVIIDWEWIYKQNSEQDNWRWLNTLEMYLSSTYWAWKVLGTKNKQFALRKTTKKCKKSSPPAVSKDKVLLFPYSICEGIISLLLHTHYQRVLISA